MRRIRTTKVAASRVDPTYVKKPRRVRIWTYAVAGILSVAAFAWWGLHEVRADRTLVSPGHLTGAHAMWENDCAKCHKPDPKGHGYLSAVTDDACLQCHDGAVHHPNQKTMVAFAPDVPGVNKRSSNCTACHIEHRGNEPLLARGDSACVSCHKDLNAVSEKPPAAQPVVEHFAMGAHPSFGRLLTPTKRWDAPATTWVDHTPLQFNHKVHMSQVQPPPGRAENCEVCHQPASDVSAGEAGRQSQRYMKPVNYEQHCSSCHSLALPSSVQENGPKLPHRDMATIRNNLGNLVGLERTWLDKQSEEVRRGLLVKTAAPARTGIPGIGRPKPSAAPAAPTVMTPTEWATKEAELVSKNLLGKYDDVGPQLPGHDQLDALLAAAAAKPPETADLSKMELVLAFNGPPAGKKLGGCALCHQLSGSPTAVFEQATAVKAAPAGAAAAPADAATNPSTQPAPSPLATLPTGFGTLPRHWFVNSHFSHDAHRSMNCVQCHGKAPTSELTSDVLLPNIDSCVSCHKAPTSADPGAGDACQLCHVYHDRSLDRDAVGGGLTISALSSKGAATTQRSRQ